MHLMVSRIKNPSPKKDVLFIYKPFVHNYSLKWYLKKKPGTMNSMFT